MLRHFLIFLAVSLAAGQSKEAPKKIRIEGSVLSSTGETISRATAALRLVDGAPQAVSAPSVATDNEGKFVFDDIPPGRYMLSVQKAGFLTRAYGARATPSQGTVLNLTLGTELKDLVVRLTPQGVITGKITDQDGDPIAGGQVVLTRYNYVRGRRGLTISGAAATDDQGDYRIGNLAPGRYYLGVADRRAFQAAVNGARSGRAELESTVPTFYPNALEAANGTPLDVTAGSELRGIDIRMRRVRVYSVKGAVVNPTTGGATAGIRMTLVPKGADEASINAEGNFSAAVVQPDGTFEFRNLRPGTFELLAPPAPTSPTVESGPAFAARMDVTVTASNIEGMIATLNPLGEVTGTIGAEDGDLATLLKAKASGQNPSRIFVRLLESEGLPTTSPSAQVKDDGSFRMAAVGASKYFLMVSGVPDGIYVKSIRFAGQDVTRIGVDNTSGAGGTMQILLSSKAAELSGSLHNDKNEAMAGVTVTLWPKIANLGTSTGGLKQAYSDQNGGFKFINLVPGEYYAAAWEELESSLAQSAEFLAHFNGDASTINVDENGHGALSPKLIPRERLAEEIAKLP